MTNLSISRLYEKQCAAEPIHLLGSVQPHGYLIVVSLETGIIVQVSEGISRFYNDIDVSTEIIGKPVSDWVRSVDGDTMIMLKSLTADNLRDIRVLRRHCDTLTSTGNWLEDAECTAYCSGKFAVLEFVPRECDPTDAITRSFDSAAFSQVLTYLSEERDIPSYLQGVAQRLQEASGYQRVMVYQFLPDWSGEVIAEATRKDTDKTYLGLRFPASDIPPQARALYLKNKLRVLADVEALPDSLFPASLPDGSMLDQSIGLLRAMSQAHLVYLKNMGVRATLTVSILLDGNLWGMIACHHDSPLVPPRYVLSLMRSTATALSSIISMRINDLSRLSYVNDEQTIFEALTAFRESLFNGAPIEDAVSTLFEDVGKVFKAAFMGVGLNGKLISSEALSSVINGKLNPVFERVISSMLPMEIRAWSHLPAHIAGLPWPPRTCGLLIGRFGGVGSCDYFFLARKDNVSVINWAGAPDKFVTVDREGEVRLEPRRSFAKWQETHIGSSEPWSRSDEELALKLLEKMNSISASWHARQMQMRLAWQSTHDSLTGLLNREGLQAILTSCLQQESVTLCLVDISQFKLINDTLGSDVGDALLQEVGARLASVVKNKERIARVGGNEFVIIVMSSDADSEEIDDLVERVSAQFTQPVVVLERHINVAVAVGVAAARVGEGDQHSIMKRAGIALTEAKRRHRTRFVVYTPEMEDSLSHELSVMYEFRRAIEQEELRLYYQPKVSLHNQKIVGFEALVRWQHPVSGLLMPGYFLPIIENTPLILEMGMWVIKTAISQLTQWQRDLDAHLSLAINLSFFEIQDEQVIACLKEHIAKLKLASHNLHIELTESTLLSNQSRAIGASDWLREQGVSIALDDFGTGYSSLSHLLAFNFDYIKIDRSFIKDVDTNPSSQRIVESLLHLAKGGGATVVAEGIERLEQAKWLQERGCEQGQGFFFGFAVPSIDIANTIAVWGIDDYKA